MSACAVSLLWQGRPSRLEMGALQNDQGRAWLMLLNRGVLAQTRLVLLPFGLVLDRFVS